MHPYGHTRKASQHCDYGCCGARKGVGVLKGCEGRKEEDRAARKRARRQDKEVIEESRESEDIG